MCGDLPKNMSHSRVNPQLAIGQLVDSASVIGADWVIASQDCFGRLCNPVTSKYHSLQITAAKRHELTFKRIELNVPVPTKMFADTDQVSQAKARQRQ